MRPTAAQSGRKAVFEACYCLWMDRVCSFWNCAKQQVRCYCAAAEKGTFLRLPPDATSIFVKPFFSCKSTWTNKEAKLIATLAPFWVCQHFCDLKIYLLSKFHPEDLLCMASGKNLDTKGGTAESKVVVQCHLSQLSQIR